MRWKSFGGTGLKVSEVCLGTMTLAGQANEKTSFAILDTAFDAGIGFLDTADCYPIPLRLETAGRSEELIGRWMDGRGVRDQLVIASKAYFPTGRLPIQRGNSRKHLTEACEESLRRLKTDRIDLYLCHGWDDTVAIEETLETLERLREQGKVLYTGLSNVRAHELARAAVAAARMGVVGFEGIQPRYNVLQREAEESLLPLAQQLELGVMVYNPIAGGLLSGKYAPGDSPLEGTRFAMAEIGETYRRRYWDEEYLRQVQELKRAAADCGVSLVTAAVAWVLRHPAVTTAIVGASRPEQLSDHIAATRTGLPPALEERLDQVWYDLPRRPPDLDTPRIADFHGLSG